MPINFRQRAPVHSTALVWVDKTQTNKVVEADPHLTVSMGRDFDHCQVSGHLYVITLLGTPVACATPEDRVIIQDGYNRVAVELWHVRPNCRRNGSDRLDPNAADEEDSQRAIRWRDASAQIIQRGPCAGAPGALSRAVTRGTPGSGRVRDFDLDWRAPVERIATLAALPVPAVDLDGFTLVEGKQTCQRRK
jgi:hypothetical protein